MKRTWLTGFVTGCLVTVLLVLGVSLLPWPPPAEAQLPEMPYEQIQIFRDMSRSLEGIERALRDRCP